MALPGFIRVDVHRPEWHEFLEARMTEFVWSVNSYWKSVRFEGCFASFPADAGRCNKAFCCRLALLRCRGLQVVGVRGARSRPLGPDAEHLAFYTVWGDYDFQKECFYVYGGAVVRPERWLFLGCGPRVFQHQRVPQASGGVSRRDRQCRRCCWNVEVPAVGGLRRGRPQAALSLWTATFGRSLST